MDSGRIYDHSTLEGNIGRLFKKFSNWVWLILPIAFVAVLLLALAVLTPSDFYDSSDQTPLETETRVLLRSSGSNPNLQEATPVPILQERINTRLSLGRSAPTTTRCPPVAPTPAPAPGDSSNLKNGTFLFRPLGTPDVLRNYSGLYAGLTEIQKQYLRKLEIHSLIIDGALLSERLADTPNLETIILDQIAIPVNFTPVFLPALKDFSLNQFRNVPIDDHKGFDSLRSVLFFRLDKNKDWDLEKDLLNLPVNIKYSVGGSTILNINRDQGIVVLNVKLCEEIYRNLDNSVKPVTNLSMSWCPVTTPELLPLSTLKYLNLNNAVPDKPLLAKLLRGATQLEEFHAFLPYACDNASYISEEYPEIMIFINLTDFSSTIRTVSLSKLAIYALPEDYISPIQSLTLETANVTGILPNFHKNFANLTKVAIFNSTSVEDGYQILEQILKTNAEWILMEDFRRNSTFTECETFLTQLGISQSAKNFLIEKDMATGQYSGKEIPPFEKHFYRYNLLRFSDIANYDIYTLWDAIHNPFKGRPGI